MTWKGGVCHIVLVIFVSQKMTSKFICITSWDLQYSVHMPFWHPLWINDEVFTCDANDFEWSRKIKTVIFTILIFRVVLKEAIFLCPPSHTTISDPVYPFSWAVHFWAELRSWKWHCCTQIRSISLQYSFIVEINKRMNFTTSQSRGV
jgi:hypothetical protein